MRPTHLHLLQMCMKCCLCPCALPVLRMRRHTDRHRQATDRHTEQSGQRQSRRRAGSSQQQRQPASHRSPSPPPWVPSSYFCDFSPPANTPRSRSHSPASASPATASPPSATLPEQHRAPRTQPQRRQQRDSGPGVARRHADQEKAVVETCITPSTDVAHSQSPEEVCSPNKNRV